MVGCVASCDVVRVTGVKCCSGGFCTCGAFSGSVVVILEAVAAVIVCCNEIDWFTDNGGAMDGWTSSCGCVYER